MASGQVDRRSKLWREQRREWDEERKPAGIAKHREIQSVDPDALSDDELVVYLRRCHDHHQSMIIQHMSFTAGAMIPTGERVKMHCDVAHPINAECRQMIEKEILNAFGAELRESEQPGYVGRTLGDGGDAVAPTEMAPNGTH